MTSERRPKNKRGGEVFNDLKKLNAKNWTYLVKDRKSLVWTGIEEQNSQSVIV